MPHLVQELIKVGLLGLAAALTTIGSRRKSPDLAENKWHAEPLPLELKPRLPDRPRVIFL